MKDAMKALRCYFLRHGVIRSVEVLQCASDAAAIERAMQLYEERKDEFAGIELWDGNRLVHHYPASVRQSAQRVPSAKGQFRTVGTV